MYGRYSKTTHHAKQTVEVDVYYVTICRVDENVLAVPVAQSALRISTLSARAPNYLP